MLHPVSVINCLEVNAHAPTSFQPDISVLQSLYLALLSGLTQNSTPTLK